MLKSMLSRCPPVSMQPVSEYGLVGSTDETGSGSDPSGLSSTMLGAGLTPVPALPTNMCPVLPTTTAWALLPLVVKVFTGM